EHWRRGEGGVDVEWTGSGRALLAKDSSAALVERFEIEYANGPILEAARQPELEDFEVLLWFRGELAENGAPLGVMPGTPAVVGAAFGKGRAMAFSPHPEKTEGLYALLHNSLLWLAPREVEEE
ncbi:MAG: biofilm PGA synthesis protein PgaB, partial [Planctomycetota bacterium]|nr:biofilm PGA synthesis protein PgaB [Planctomycetota bacterium]